MVSNEFIQYGLDGFEFTEEYRVPGEGEYYLLQGLDGDRVMRAGDSVKVRKPILRREESFVQVRVEGHGRRTWTYRDTEGDLKEGDFVLVPFGFNNAPALGQVIEPGRGGWNGYVKDVRTLLIDWDRRA